MDTTMLNSILRHIITGVGAVLVTKGYTDQAGLELIAGGVTTVVGLVLSYFDKRKAAATLEATKANKQ